MHDLLRRGDASLAERGTRRIVEILQVVVGELREVRERDLAVLRVEGVDEHVTVRGRKAADIDRASNLVGPRIDGRGRDAGAGGVADEHDRAPCCIDGGDDGSDVIVDDGDAQRSRRRILLPSRPGRLARSPMARCLQWGVTSSHDAPSSQSPGTSTMSMTRPYEPPPTLSWLNGDALRMHEGEGRHFTQLLRICCTSSFRTGRGCR